MSVSSQKTFSAPLTTSLFLAAMLFGLGASVSEASARDISLGGHREEQRHSLSPNETQAKLPDDALALPRVVVSVQNHETGRWQRVLVDAYFQSADHHALSQVRDRLKDIAAKAGPQLQTKPAEFLQSAHGGARTAKDCIRLAAEESLGHSWGGSIFIRSLAVF
ncbi:hypothetical protein [Telmatospirillum sp.]|uniref:hypothetical protein n=1 Tax=Telmatospirillum sp. TaxID=2079197 RepID=UPI0028405484|nr:hypothetical protein [Telmatospirillum sp.]MDR3437018.1 hypothetical protein [Telmatospirillum sp.]